MKKLTVGGIVGDEGDVEKDDAGVNREENPLPLGERVLRRQCLAAERGERNCGCGSSSLESTNQLAAGDGAIGVLGEARGREEAAAAAEVETRAKLRRQGSDDGGGEVLKSRRHGSQLVVK